MTNMNNNSDTHGRSATGSLSYSASISYCA